MLLKYSVNNLELNMFPSEECISDDKFLMEINTVAGKMKVLKRACILEDTKTSFLTSISCAIDCIKGIAQSQTSFKLNKFTSFQFLIYVDKQVYNYGFSWDKSYVYEEWLAVLNSSGKFDLLFDRYKQAQFLLPELSNVSSHAHAVLSWLERIHFVKKATFIENSSNDIIIANKINYDDFNDLTNCQFIFTTKDSKFLNLEKIDKDEIWFHRNEHLYPLSDYSVKKGQNIQKDYLAGRF